MQDIITGIDIGSNVIRIIVGQRVTAPEGGDQLHIIGVSSVPSEGINKGIINSIDDAVSSVSTTLEKVERMAGVPIEKAFIGISGLHVLSQTSKGVIAVSKANGEIEEEDVNRVVEAAQAVASPPNYEIIHVIPKSFVVDNQAGIKDPVGMTGVRLEVEAQIIQGLSSQIKNLTKTIYRTGIDIEDLVLSSLAASESILTKKQKELGVVLVNIGGPTTSIAVFEEGDLIHSAIVPIGSSHITSDIAIGLRTSLDIAEQIKLKYGTALVNSVNEDDKIDMSEFDPNDTTQVNRHHVAEIIEARLEEIFDLVDKELRAIKRSGLLPAGVVLCGGGAKLQGAVDLAKVKFRLPAFIGNFQHLKIVCPVEQVRDIEYAVALGLVLWGDQMKERKGRRINFSSIGDVKNKIKNLFKSFVP